jgi:hypothetical protein
MDDGRRKTVIMRLPRSEKAGSLLLVTLSAAAIVGALDLGARGHIVAASVVALLIVVVLVTLEELRRHGGSSGPGQGAG